MTKNQMKYPPILKSIIAVSFLLSFAAANINAEFYNSQIVMSGENKSYSDSIFQTSWTVADNGGSIQADGSILRVGNSIFKNNKTASYKGGAVYLNNTSATFSNVTFDNNQAEYGGALSFNAENLYLNAVEFNNNFVSNMGGALYLDNSGTPVIIRADNLSFNNNMAVNGGGAMSIHSELNLIADNLSFIENQSYMNGGGAIRDENGMHIDAANIVFKENAVSSGITSGNGGAIYTQSGNFDIKAKYILFEDNYADYEGGAIANNGNMYIFADDIIFANNTSAQRGGAIRIENGDVNIGYYSDGTPVSSATNIVFKDNVSSTGGAVYVSNNNLRLAGKITFENNRQANGILNDMVLGDSANVEIAAGSTITFDGGIIARRDDGEQDYKRRGSINFGEGAVIIAKLGVWGDAAGAISANQISADGTVFISYLSVDKKYLTNNAPRIFKLFDSDNPGAIAAPNIERIDRNPFYSIISADTNNYSFLVKRRYSDEIAGILNIDSQYAGNIVSFLSDGNGTQSETQFGYLQVNIYDLFQTPDISNTNSALLKTQSLFPSEIPVVQINVLQLVGQANNIASQRLIDVSNLGDFEDSRISLWGQGLYNSSNFKDDNSNELELNAGGGALGLELFLEDRAKVGVGFMYSASAIDINSAIGVSKNIDANSVGALIYAEYKPSKLFFDAVLSYASGKYDEDKTISEIPVSSKWTVNDFSTLLSAGYEGEVFGLIVIPQIGVQYIYFAQNDYQDILGAHEKLSSNILSGIFDIKIKKDFIGEASTIKPFISFGVAYDMSYDNPAQIVNMPNGKTLTVQMEELEPLTIKIGAGVAAEISQFWNVSLSYGAGLRDKYNSHTVFFIIQYSIK